jgi:hypothetical protein
MGLKRTDELRKKAVRIALTNGLASRSSWAMHATPRMCRVAKPTSVTPVGCGSYIPTVYYLAVGIGYFATSARSLPASGGNTGYGGASASDITTTPIQKATPRKIPTAQNNGVRIYPRSKAPEGPTNSFAEVQ